GGARRVDLRLKVHVRAHGERHALAALAVLEMAQLDDGARPAIARRLDVGKLDEVGAPAGPVNDRISPAAQFVMEAGTDQPAADGRRGSGFGQLAGGATGDAAVGHRLVHPLYGVAALPPRARGGLRVVRERALARRGL